MLFYLNLQDYQFQELFSDVGSKPAFMHVKIKLLEYLYLWTGNVEVKAPYVCIDFENLHRAFLVNYDGNKIISFCFDFIIKTTSPDYNSLNSIKSVHYMGKSGIVNLRNISEANTILSEYTSREDNLYIDLIFDDEDNIAPESFTLFEYLLFHEDGYIRYDYDFKNQHPITHPLNHFDVHYSEPSHYKVGLPSKLVLSDFMTILDKKKICSKLDPNPIPQYQKIGRKKKRGKPKH